MTDPVPHPFEVILHQCAQAMPEPWYPSAYAQATGTSRDNLDPYLNELRLAGLISLTDWVQGHGQGYTLTPRGTEIMSNPRLLARMHSGQLFARKNRPPVSTPGRRGSFSTWERGETARAAFYNHSVAGVTFLLMAINILWFVAGIRVASYQGLSTNNYLKGTSNDPRQELALEKTYEIIGDINGPDFYLHRQWWRLLSAAFVHIGLMHLGGNMFSLYIVGPIVERMWGHGRFLILYLVTALGGNCGALIGNPVAGGAGASTALWGIMVSMGVWIYLNRQAFPSSLVASWAQRLLLVMALELYFTFTIPHISKGGHLGGGIVGLLAAVPLDYLRFGNRRQRLLALTGLIAIPVLCVTALFVFLAGSAGKEIQRSYRARNIAEFQEELQGFLQLYGATIDEATKNARDVYQEFEPLSQQRRWDPEDAQQTLTDLAETRGKLQDAANHLKNAPRYASERMREIRQRSLEYIQAWDRLLELAKEFLQPAGNRDNKEKLLQQQYKRVNEAWQDLQAAQLPYAVSRSRAGALPLPSGLPHMGWHMVVLE